MKILNLTAGSKIYTSNAYLVLGSWNAIDDVNTLIDVGRDPSVIETINDAATGVGKKRVEQVILTHNHYDHASNLPLIREAFNPRVYAFSSALEGVDYLLKGGEILRVGDRVFEVIYAPGHSNDSICLFCDEEGILFSGDVPVVIQSAEGTYEPGFVAALEKLSERNIKSIYFGHGAPVLSGGKALINMSLKNVKKSMMNKLSIEGKAS